MQSSDTPGYQKVQTTQPNDEVTINVQNQPTYDIKSADEIAAENDANWWKELGYSLIGPAILLAIGGATKLGKFIEGKFELNRKSLKFDKDANINQSLLKLGNFSLQCNEVREKVNQAVAQKGQQLTESSQKQVQNMLQEVDQQEYNAYKDFFNRYSIKDEEIKTINMKQQKLRDEIKNLEDIIERKQKYSGKQIDQDITYSENLMKDLGSESARLTNKYLHREGEMIDKNERSLADRIQNDSPDKLTNFMFDKGFSKEDQKIVQNLHKRFVDEKNAIMKEREKYYMIEDKTPIEEYQKQIAEKQNELKYLQEQLDVGVFNELKPWLEHLPEGYQKTKQGLIDYVFDEFNTNKRQPEAFDQLIYEYNRDRNNPILKYSVDEGTFHKQQQTVKEQAQKFLQDATNATKVWTDKLKSGIEIIPQSVRDNEMLKPLFNSINKIVETGNIESKEIIQQLNQVLAKVNEQGKKYMSIAEKIVGTGDEKSLLQKAAGLYEKFRLKFNKEDIGMLQSLVKNGKNILEETTKLQKFLEGENVTTKSLLEYASQYSDKLGTIGKELQKITDWVAKKDNLPEIIDKLFIPGKWKDVIKPALDMIHSSGMLGKDVSRFIGNLPKMLESDKFGLLSSLLKLTKKTTGKDLTQYFTPIEDALDALSYFSDVQKWRTNPVASRKYETKMKRQQLDYFDIKNLLSSDLQEQERLVKNLTDQHNIFWREHLKIDEKPIDEFLNSSIKPTEEQRKFIEQQRDEQQKIKGDQKYIKYSQLLQKPTTREIKEQLRKDANTAKTNLKSQKGFRQQQLDKVNQKYGKQINELEELYKTKEADQKKLGKSRDSIIGEINNYNNQIENLNDKIGGYEKEIKEQENYIENAKQLPQIKNLEEIPTKKGLLKRVAGAALDTAKKYTGIGTQSAESILKQMAKSYEKIDQLQNESLPFKDKRADLQNMLKQKQGELKTLDTQFESAKQSLSETEGKLNELKGLKQKDIDSIKRQYSETIAKLQQNMDIANQQYKDIENLERTNLLDTDNKDYVQDGDEFYSTGELQQYLNDQDEKVNYINKSLEQYEPQMNWMNAEKYKDDLTAAQRYRSEELFHTQRRNQEKMQFDRTHGLWVPRPLYNNTWLEVKAAPVDTIEQTQKKLEKLGYKPNTSYYLDGEQKIIEPEDAIELQYNPHISEELQKLKAEYQDKLLSAKSFDRPKIKNEYENARQQKLQELQNTQNLAKINESPQLLMSQVLSTKQPMNKYGENIRQLAGTFYDTHKNSRKKEWLEFKQTFPDKKTQRNNYIDSQLQELENIENQLISPESIKDWNKLIDKLDPLDQYELKLPEKSTKQTWQNYLYQFDEDYLGYKPTKAPKNEVYSYPAENSTFKIKAVEEVPIINYLEDNGLKKDDMDITKQYNFFKDPQSVQIGKQLKLVKDDILPKYDGDNQTARAWKELFSQRIDKIKYPVQSKVYNTHKLQRILNNLEYLQKSGIVP